MLTKKQYELLLFIHHRLNHDGVSPSFDEMKDALHLKSKSGIHRLITGLEERGFLRRLPNRARALEVVKLPENTEADRLPVRNKKIDRLRAQGVVSTPAPAYSTLPPPMTVSLPLFGRIAAGTPIEALRDHSTVIDVPIDLLGKGEHYALEIDGESMVEAGILDGDTVVIERADVAENGDIIVALVEGHEATLKRFRRRGDTIALEPANRAFETRIYRPDQIRVQGRLVGLIRKY